LFLSLASYIFSFIWVFLSTEIKIYKESYKRRLKNMSDKPIDLMWDDEPVNVTSEVNFIWSIANKLRGPYRSDKYKDVIIPMVIIRRLECALEDTKEKVLARFDIDPDLPTQVFCRTSGYDFYNTSKYDLAELVNEPDHIAGNFREYIKGFSANVQDIIRSLEFDKQIDKMEENDRLYSVVKAFSELDLSPKTIDNVKMGYIFEDLIRRFSENAEAGDHYTGRDIIKTMVSIILAEGCDDIFDDNKVITILDQAAGTGGMLSTAYNYIHRFNPTADIRMFSQEVNPESYAICLAEMLIKGQNAENVRYQDTMKKDCFPDIKMRFVLENPPFGTPWAGKDSADGVEDAVRAEHIKIDSRWGVGLPAGSDMQLLFIQSAIDKLDDECGRAAIIENGSPLFTGGTSSGESQIRRFLLENDLLEAIIALPTDLFYNTGIATYIWVISKNKRAERKGKIQLIDASNIYHKLRKALSNKKNELSPEDREKITRLYADFKENDLCKIYDNEEFMYREYSVMQPLQRSYGITEERMQNMLSSGVLNSLYDEAKVYALENAEFLTGKEEKKLETYYEKKPIYDAIIQALRENISDSIYMNPESFMPVLTEILEGFANKKLLERIADGLSVLDKKADIQRDKKGNIIYDKTTKDTEIVKYQESIEDYMAREVLPYVPDAKWFFEENLGAKNPVIKTGAEIPFTRYFYKYQQPESSKVLEQKFFELEKSVNKRIAKLFKED
jgi:type I restriction enzyme M protein